MTTGTTPFSYPDGQLPNQFKIEPDNHYYQFRLHEARALFNSVLPIKTECLLLISEVTNTFYPDTTIRSLHSIKMVQRNKPCQMGVRINLTDWLPARAKDSCTVTIKYVGIQASPVKDLLAQLEQAGLIATISALDPKWQVALKVSNIVGKILSYLMKEGQSHELFSVTHQFSLSDLQTGYYAAIGSKQDKEAPSSFRLDSQQNLLDGFSRRSLVDWSYALLHIDAVTCMGEEVVRQESWWELLQTTKEEILNECTLSDVLETEKRKELTNKWKDTLIQAGKLTRQDRGYLLKEVKGIIQSSSAEVLSKLQPPKTSQSFGSESLSELWHNLLEVSTLTELQQFAEDYQHELDWSYDRLQQSDLQ
jgi:hypothetical protein